MKQTTFWQRFDTAYTRGELLQMGSEFSRLDLAGDDAKVAKLAFRAEACTLDTSDPSHARLVERFGQKGPAAHSVRSALAYAHASFFIGDRQTCIDALHQAAVTAVRAPDGRSPTLRRLRAEAYLRLADFWCVFNQPGLAVSHLQLAHQVTNPLTEGAGAPGFPAEFATRILARLRWLCAGRGPGSTALLMLPAEGKWATLYDRLTDHDWSALPEFEWPSLPDPEEVASQDGLRAAFELCLSEALSLRGADGLRWARKAAEFAQQMESPAWMSVADVTAACLASNVEDYRGVCTHLSRSLEMVQRHKLEGLLAHAMLANLPLEGSEGPERAALQAGQAVDQILGLTVPFRDPVMRRRYRWCFEEAFAKSYRWWALSGNRREALMAIALASGFGWRSTGTGRASLEELLAARRKETGDLLIGEGLFQDEPSMRDSVSGPPTSHLPGVFSEADRLMQISDSIARAESLQLLRERIFGMAQRTPVEIANPPQGTWDVYFLVEDDLIHRVDVTHSETLLLTLGISTAEIRSLILDSGLSVTTAKRTGPVQVDPIDTAIAGLFSEVPTLGPSLSRVRIWPHGILHLLPFTSALRLFLPQAPFVSVMLGIEKRAAQTNRYGPAVRLAPLYHGGRLPKAEREVEVTKNEDEIVYAGVELTGEKILRLLFSPAKLLHFAGDTVNRNDQPELAGLLGSDGSLVTAADILNLGSGPEAVVLSACDGPGPLHSADGSYGLARAFLQVGAKWVLASLWQTGDAETLTSMTSFFENLDRGMDPEASLPHTKHPFVVYRPAF